MQTMLRYYKLPEHQLTKNKQNFLEWHLVFRFASLNFVKQSKYGKLCYQSTDGKLSHSQTPTQFPFPHVMDECEICCSSHRIVDNNDYYFVFNKLYNRPSCSSALFPVLI